LRFGPRVEIARFFIPGADFYPGLTTTTPEMTTVHTLVAGPGGGTRVPVGTRTKTRLRHVLRDFTGDGLPDVLYKVVDDHGNWRWYLHANRLTPSGPDLSTTTGSWGSGDGPEDLQMSTTLDPTRGAGDPSSALRDAMVTTETWTQFADWNGDGRLDVIDADGGTDGDHWRVWLNELSITNGVAWRAIQVDVGELRHWLEGAQGYVQVADMPLGIIEQHDWSENLPLERSRTWHRYASSDTTRYEWTGTNWSELPHLREDSWERTFSTNSLTEWQLADSNGDGFLDFAASTVPVQRCFTNSPPNACHIESPIKYCSSTFSEAALATTDCDHPGESTRGRLALALNRLGPFTPEGGRPFSEPKLVDGSGADATFGISQWATGSDRREGNTTWYTSDEIQAELWSPNETLQGVTWQVTALADRPGAGMLRLALRDPSGGTTTFESDEREQCPGRERFVTVQTGGEADLDGDGRPDLIYPPADWHPDSERPWADHWNVRFATGSGYGPVRRLTAPADHLFALSEARSPCSPDPDHVPETHTTAGLTDMDGDGRPELLRVSGEGRLFMSRLATPVSPVKAGARRMITIDNGHGAITSIEYGNRKEIDPDGGRVPWPEIVVTAIRTAVVDGSAPPSAPTYYGYGQPSIGYEPLAGRWSFEGYRRQVTLSGRPSQFRPGMIDGVVTFVDRSPRAAPGSSYAEHVVGGQVARTSAMERYGIDASWIPWLLADFTFINPFAASTPTYGVVKLADAQPVTGDAEFDCGDLEPASGKVAGTGLCGAAGLVQVTGTESWEGGSAPPANDNVLSGSSVDWTDPYGRPLLVHERGDLRRDDDDRCTRTAYASTPDGGLFPTVVSRVTIDDCGYGPRKDSGGPDVILSSVGHRYDGLPEGQVSAGLLTARTIDRYGPTGYLDTIDAEQVEYGLFAQPRIVRSQRVLGSPATRETVLTYDAFAATVISSTVTGSDVAPRSSKTEVSTWPSRPTSVTAPTGEGTTVERDGFGRAVRTLVRPKDGSNTTIARTIFHDHGAPRRIDAEVFPVGAAPGSEDIASDRQRATTVLDAFGRPRYRQRELGGDYGGGTLISGLVEYDAEGQVVFAAQPFAAPTTFDPAVMMQAPYGTTLVHDLRGRVVRAVSTYGHDEHTTVSSPASQTFVTSMYYGHAAGQAFSSVTGADGNDPTDQVHAGVHAVAWSTAIGRELETATIDAGGLVLDRVATRYDRLGRVVETQRFGAQGTSPVIWRSTFDSLGRSLTHGEPGTSDQVYSYDEDGNLLESWWLDGPTRRGTRFRYDALGRPTTRTLVRQPTSGAEIVEGVDRYHYDTAYGLQPPGAGSYLGRLAAVTTDDVGGVYYGYDELGRTATTTYDYDGQELVRESAAYTSGGRLTALALAAGSSTDKIGYEYDSAARVRYVRDDAGPTVYFAATSVLPDGHYDSVMYGNGVSETFAREPAGRQQVFDWTTVTAKETYRFTRRFDAAGRITSERQETPSSVADLSHDYDPLGRLQLTTQSGGDNDGIEWFAHDPLGNLKLRIASTAAGTREYTPDPADPDRLCRYAPLGSAGPCQFTYVTVGDGGYRFHRNHRCPGAHPVARGRFFALAAGRRVTRRAGGARWRPRPGTASPVRAATAVSA
jgi:hypothetical protein